MTAEGNRSLGEMEVQGVAIFLLGLAVTLRALGKSEDVNLTTEGFLSVLDEHLAATTSSTIRDGIDAPALRESAVAVRVHLDYALAVASRADEHGPWVFEHGLRLLLEGDDGHGEDGR